jgi:hypothetical protein
MRYPSLRAMRIFWRCLEYCDIWMRDARRCKSRSLSVRMVCRPWVLDIGSEMPRDVDHVATTRSYCDHNINENE